MFKRAECLHYCSKEYTQRINHEKSIIRNLKNKSIIEKLDNNKNFSEMIRFLPSGTLFSRDLDTNKIYVSLPFFSSHFKLPVKEGEHVWIYVDSNEYNSKNSISNSYWLSRIHGLFFSEDVNYTYNIRDRLLNIEKILNAKKNKQLEEYFVRLPTNNNYENILSLSKESETNVPRFFSDQKDLTLQGSNNTIISLSNSESIDGIYSLNDKKEGKISLISGRGSYFKKPNKKFETINTKTLGALRDFREDFEETKVVKIKNDRSTISNGVYNNLNKEENFKMPEFITSDNSNKIHRNVNEGAPYLTYDASSLIISEKENKSSFEFIKKFMLKNIDSVKNEKESEDIKASLEIENAITNKKATKTICLPYLESPDEYSPAICLYSTDIHIVSRNDSSIYNEKLDGSIYLIKNSDNNESYGEISLRENGNIAINGNKILIGDYEREETKESGQGSTVIIGNGGELNSLVLGEKLVLLLSELIEINKESLKLISSSLKETKYNFDTCNDNFNSINNWANTHIHNALGPTSPVSPTTAAGTTNQTPVAINSIEIDKVSTSIINEKEPNLTDKLENLIIKMDKILSKFAKTS